MNNGGTEVTAPVMQCSNAALGTGIIHWSTSVGPGILQLLEGVDPAPPPSGVLSDCRAEHTTLTRVVLAATRGQVPACKAGEARPIGNAKPKESGVQEPSSCGRSYGGQPPTNHTLNLSVA